MNGSGSEFDQADMDLLQQAHAAQNAADAAAGTAVVEETPPVPPAPPAPPAPAAPAAPTPPAPPAPAAPAAPAAPTAPAVVEPQGDVRAALRHSRHAEREARRRADELTRENEELRKAAPAAPAVPKLSEKVRTDLEELAPEAALALSSTEQALAAANAETERLRQQLAAAAPPADKVFSPERLPDDIQDVVDSVPQLAEWQNSKDHQALWEAVKAADVFLETSGTWKGKPLADRFNAAIAMVKTAQAPAAPAPAPAADPATVAAAKIAALQVQPKPLTVGSLGSGDTPGNEQFDPHQAVKQGLSDEEIIARLG